MQLTNGSLWTYMGRNEAIYRCPLEPNSSFVRTYSISNYTGGHRFASLDIIPTLNRQTIVRPQNTYVFVEEADPRGSNMGSFVAANLTSSTSWTDVLASYHMNGSALSFADGHAGYYGNLDQDTAAITALMTPAPSSRDLEFFKRNQRP